MSRLPQPWPGIVAMKATASSGPIMSACGFIKTARPYMAPARIRFSRCRHQHVSTSPSVNKVSICPHAPETYMSTGQYSSRPASAKEKDSDRPFFVASLYTSTAETRSAMQAGSLNTSAIRFVP